jgi:ABC-type molybdate transport system permease subunit
MVAGAILAFAKAMGEFGATITFVSNIPGQTRTLPSAIYAFLQVPGGEGAALRLVAVSVAVAMGALLAVRMAGAAWQGGCRAHDAVGPLDHALAISRSIWRSRRRPV